MAMRSQVYAWDLFNGTETTGAPLTIQLDGGGTSGYSATGGVATTNITGSGSGLAIVIDSVNGGGQITAFSVQTDGEGANASGYKVGDKFNVSGGSGDAAGTVLSINPLAGGQHIPLGTPVSIFTSGKGNQLGRLPNTTATQFVVIDSYGCTPSTFTAGSNIIPAWLGSNTLNGQKVRNSIAGPRAYLQIYVNSTGYFKDPDGVPRDGVPGTSIPYPRTINNSYCKTSKQTPIYILPGQVWDVRLTCFNDAFCGGPGGETSTPIAQANGELQAFIKYTLYDGADALIATKLMEMGIAVTPNAVDNYKQKTIEAQMAADARKALEE